MSEFVTIARVGDIPDQEGRAFKVNKVTVAVFNDGGTYRAIDDMCPHAGASLASGFFENDIVTCPWHAWQFKVSDGSFCGHPRLKSDVYAVRVMGDEIQVSTTPVNRSNSCSGQTTPDTSEPHDE
jgi:nitrite reductase (NADH) small subunit/3-phenylpropionate/trans-cinnamate dioxygenase ferredoxin subunit